MKGLYKHKCVSTMDQQNYSTTPSRVIALPKKVQVVYYLSYRDGLLEQPHLMEISLSSSRGLCLRDVKTQLMSLRGVMSSSFSWSYKRSYKKGFVWQDLESDDDLIFPTHNGSENVVKGCRIESISCTVEQQIPPSPQNMHQNWTRNVRGHSLQMQPAASKLAELPAPSTLTQLTNASDNYANASSRRGDDNIPFNLGVIEGLMEHLRLAKAIDVNYEDTEAFNYRSHLNVREKHNRNIETRKEPTHCKHHLQVPINEREAYDSAEFSVIKKIKNSSNISSLYVEADVTTQTGDDVEIMNIVEEYGQGKLPCLPEFYHTDNLACLNRKDGSFFKKRVSSQGTLIELGQDEISPPPCSTSSASTKTSAHSAASGNVVSYSIGQLQKLGLNKSSYLVADKNLQEMEVLLPSRVCADKKALLNEEEAIATKPPVDCNSKGRETPSVSAKFNANVYFDAADDHSHENLEAALNSSKMKPHVMNLRSGSGRFLHSVSCGRELEVFKPMDARRIKRIPRKMSYIQGAKSEEYSCLNFNVNDGSESATNADSCLPIAPNHGPGKVICNEENHFVALSSQDSNSDSKKLWHLRGWGHSNHKKKWAPKFKSILTNFTVDEDAP